MAETHDESGGELGATPGTVGHLKQEIDKLLAKNKWATDAVFSCGSSVVFTGITPMLCTWDPSTSMWNSVDLASSDQHCNAVALATRPGKSGDVLRLRYFGMTEYIQCDVRVGLRVALGRVREQCNDAIETDLNIIIGLEHIFQLKDKAFVFPGASGTRHCWKSLAELKEAYPLHVGFIELPLFMFQPTISVFAFRALHTWSDFLDKFFCDLFAKLNKVPKQVDRQNYRLFCVQCSSPQGHLVLTKNMLREILLSRTSLCCKADVWVK